jgi:hypothetical protein
LNLPKRLFRDRPRPEPSRSWTPGDPIFVSPEGPPAPAKPDLSRFAVLVPFMDSIIHHVENGLRELEFMGLTVVRRPGCSAIDYVRSAMASQALMEGMEAVLFIDSDVLFNPKDALRLLMRPEPIVAGVYAQNRFSKLNVNPTPETTEIAYGDRGQDYEVKAVGAGFLRIRSEALIRIAEHHQLPTCTASGSSVIPFFMPFAKFDEDLQEWMYLCEDFAICERAREAGLKIIADTRINLYHLGLYPYGFAEASVPEVKRSRGGVIPVNFPAEESAG